MVAEGVVHFLEAIEVHHDDDPDLAVGVYIRSAMIELGDGLVDEIGYLEDAVDRAIELAHLDKSNVRVVKYKPELG
ncbi:MAG: hypothetical protein WCI22_14035, partial [Actinomycetota bacterium]